MATDPNWLYSTIAQSSAAIVAIIGGFITATVLNLLSEKRNLKNQREDKKTRIETLRKTREDLIKELEPKEVLSFIESITNDIINSDNLPSFEEIKDNYPYTQNLNLEMLKKDYEPFIDQIIKARSFIKKYSDEITAKGASTFDEWVKTYHLEISSYNYEFLEKEYNKVIAKKRESLSSIEQMLMPPNMITMSLPYIQPISEQQELKSLCDKIQESKYEITSLENDTLNLDVRIESFSFPPNLKWGIAVLGFLSIFSIFLPVLIISQEAYFTWSKWLTTASFWVGIIGVFAYIVFQIRVLRRK
jgi:uncharacterized iron-regulated protein